MSYQNLSNQSLCTALNHQAPPILFLLVYSEIKSLLLNTYLKVASVYKMFANHFYIISKCSVLYEN